MKIEEIDINLIKPYKNNPRKNQNIDKVANNKYAIMINDFHDHFFFKNYNNNAIDLLYNSELLYEIYFEYSDIFNTVLNSFLINKKILEEVNVFSNKYFNRDTISIHIRSWNDCI